MRILAVVLALTACDEQKTSPPPSQPSQSGSAAVAPPAALALQRVTLLHPEATIEQRVPEPDAIATTLEKIVKAMTAYDTRHAGVLPNAFDVTVVVRPTAMRAWFAAASGDVSIPQLEATIAKLPRFVVREANVGVVLTIARSGVEELPRGAYVPAAWKAAAGHDGADVDQVIDKVWPVK